MFISLKFRFLIAILCLSIPGQSQEKNTNPVLSPPVPAEILIGNNRLAAQVLINKRFSGKSRFGILTSSFFAADYSNKATENESMQIALLSYEAVKGIGLVSGVAMNAHWGFRPFTGMQLHYANPTLLTMVIPGFYLTESHNFETVGFIEFRPRIKNEWSVYSRAEGLYNADMDTKKHERSYFYGRLGVKFNSFAFGLGVNYDWYGPFRHKKENAGLFFRHLFR